TPTPRAPPPPARRGGSRWPGSRLRRGAVAAGEGARRRPIPKNAPLEGGRRTGPVLERPGREAPPASGGSVSRGREPKHQKLAAASETFKEDESKSLEDRK